MSEESNKAIVRRYYDEILNKSRLEVIDELMSPDLQFTIVSGSGPLRGPNRFKRLLSSLRESFPDLQFALEQLVAEGDAVVGHWTATGTHVGSPLSTVLGEIPASGRAFRIEGTSWLRIVDGRIRESLVNEDTLGLLAQLGAVPASEPPVGRPEERATTVVTRYFDELLNQGRLDFIDEHIDEEVTFRIPMLPEPLRGRDAMRAFVSDLRAAFPDLRFSVEREVVDGDKAAARWHLTATHCGTFLGIPPTGTRVEDLGEDIFRLVDGRIAEIWVNEDDFGLQQQLEATRVPLSAAVSYEG